MSKMMLILMCSGFVVIGTVLKVVMPQDPMTPITAQVVRAGAGNVFSEPTERINLFFRDHPQVALQIAPQCEPALKHSNIKDWIQTTEGRICQVATINAGIAELRNTRIVADN